MDNALGRKKENLLFLNPRSRHFNFYLPFVISTEAEIIQPTKDYRNGRISSIDF
ncbi:MAG: hypothetical protein PUP93_06090 [Rhizonema sp. NSF051]|nr:hypothetical protein [Rhizonema sp. NSF051]